MKNILGIIRHDLGKITGSVVALITIMGLCIVPCLYAWFNIFSNWAPYESEATGRIKVAVANNDEGTSLAGLEINVGDKIVDALKANDAIGWTFTESDEEAIEGTYAGDYYATIVIPESFTEDVLSFTRGDLENPTIKYYENEKKNAIAPKITGKAKTALQEEVNAAFVETLAGYVTDAASVANANGVDPSEILADLADRIDDLGGDLNSCIALADSAAGLTNAAGNLMGVSGTFIGSTQDALTATDDILKAAEDELADIKKIDTKTLDKAKDKLKEVSDVLDNFDPVIADLIADSDTAFDLFVDTSRDRWVSRVDKIKSQADEQKKTVESEGFTALGEKFGELSQTLDDISTDLKVLDKNMSKSKREEVLERIAANIDMTSDLTRETTEQIKTDIDTNLENALSNSKTSVSDFRKTMKSANSDLGKLSGNLNSYNSALTGLKKSISKTVTSIASLQDGAESISALLMDASGNELLYEISDLMDGDDAAVAEYLANPVKMDTEVIWPIETYGSAMAPFYTVLAQWVGALLTAVLIKTRVKKNKELENLRLHEWYFGRFGLYLIVGLAQGLIVSLGDLLYIGIQCTAPLKFVLAACVNGVVFMMINYALVFALDNIGLGAGVIVLVLQVAGSGGTYPVEVLPGIFRTLYPLMPFRYAMDAMRECIGGMYGNTYWKCLGMLGLFFVFAVFFGLAFYHPARKLNEVIAASKAKSEIML